MNRLAAALAYTSRGLVCPRCKVRKPTTAYAARSTWCRQCYRGYHAMRRQSREQAERLRRDNRQ